MNNQRRKEISRITAGLRTLEWGADRETLEDYKNRIESVYDEEQDAYDNMPENLQCSARGEASEEAQENLEEAMGELEEWLSDTDEERDEFDFEVMIDEVVDCLNEAAI